MNDEALAPDVEIVPPPMPDFVPEPVPPPMPDFAPESTFVTQEPAADPPAAASDCVTSSAPEPVPEPVPDPTPEPAPDPSPVTTLAPPTSSSPPAVDQDSALDDLLGVLQSIDAALASDELSTDEVPADEVPADEISIDEPSAVESIAPYDVVAVELDPGALAVVDAIRGVKSELILISDQVADIQLSMERPLLTTPFEDYTVSEGLLLLLFLCAFLSACFRLLRGGFKWLRS